MNALKPKLKTAKPRPEPARLHWRVYPSHEVLCHLDRVAAARRACRFAAHSRYRSRAGLEGLLARAAVKILAGRGEVHCLVFVWQDRRYALSARYRAADLRWIVEIGLADHPLPLLLPRKAAVKGRTSP